MASNARRNFAFDTISEIARLTSLSQVGEYFAGAMAKLGFTSLGINGLPPPVIDADPVILTESTPGGFRDHYIQEQFYLVDHIAGHARVSTEPFRYSDAPYGRAESKAHQRFLQALRNYNMGEGIIVPVGRPAHIPACVWLAGESPDLTEETMQVVQLIALFASSKAHALYQHCNDHSLPLTAREREVLIWAAHGKSSWEIGRILHIAKLTVDEHTQRAARKLGAANKTQAVALALLEHMIEL
jgi:LuxR family transcriptional regulator, quorum-sensing system regulator BjaR1